MATTVTVPWAAWYGDLDHSLTFPDGWRVAVHAMRDAPDIGATGIVEALRRPIGTPALADLAVRRRSAAVVVDDLSQPTPAYRLMPILLATIEEGGVPPEEIRVIMGTATRRPLVHDDLLKKLGREVVARYEVVNHQPYENLEDLGISSQGTPIRVNRTFLDADLRIGLGCIVPHAGVGFGGGGAIVMPAIAGAEAAAWMHDKLAAAGVPMDREGDEQRADIEEIVERVGLDLVVDVVPTSRRGIAGIFAGDAVEARRAGISFAHDVFATPLPDDLVDIVVTNAYPLDTHFLQAGTALNILESAWRTGNRVLRPGGTTVVIAACPEGRGYDSLFGAGGRLHRHRDEPLSFDRMHSAGPVYYTPNVNPRDANGLPVRSDWDGLIAQLLAIHGRQATVAVFPTGALQVSAAS